MGINSIHPTHRMRSSDASTFDAICELCGAVDATPATRASDEALRQPCPKRDECKIGAGFAFFAWIRYRGRWQQCDGTGWRCAGCRGEWLHMQRWRYGGETI